MNRTDVAPGAVTGGETVVPWVIANMLLLRASGFSPADPVYRVSCEWCMRRLTTSHPRRAVCLDCVATMGSSL